MKKKFDLMNAGYILRFWVVFLFAAIVFVFISIVYFDIFSELENQLLAVILISVVVGTLFSNIFNDFFSPFKSRRRKIRNDLINSMESGQCRLSRQWIELELVWLEFMRTRKIVSPILINSGYERSKAETKTRLKLASLDKEDIKLPEFYEQNNRLHDDFRQVLRGILKRPLRESNNIIYYEDILPFPLKILIEFDLVVLLPEYDGESMKAVRIK